MVIDLRAQARDLLLQCDPAAKAQGTRRLALTGPVDTDAVLIELSMVSGVGQPSAYGIVVLAEHIRPTLSDPAVRAEIEAEMTALLKRVNAAVADYERLQMLVIAKEPWSIENGCLTPTMKIKRSRIEAEVQSKIDNWYSARGPVLWA